METTTEHKCPACGAPLHFDPNSQLLVCDYCGNKFSIEQVEEAEAKEAEASAEPKESEESTASEKSFDWGDYKANLSGEKLEGTKVFECKSCGASIETDTTTMALTCPYCHNNTVLNEVATGGLKPNKIIPFKFTKDKLPGILRSFYWQKKLLPRNFFTANKVGDPIGVYVPFWLFDTKISGDTQFSAKKTRSYTQGDYRYHETKHYAISRAGSLSFKQVPVDASQKMDDELMDSLEPFNYSELTDFDNRYLAGYCADRFDRSPDEELPRAQDRMTRTAEKHFSATISGYSDVKPSKSNYSTENPSVIYAMVPVYLFECKYDGKNYQYAVNGQTGKIVGELPLDKKKERFWYWFTFLLTGGLTALVMLLLQIIF
ncbi:MAG: hypothetical protein J6S81_05745 [Treponema sp.]|nr:hypothetical protein [Treponema sp.]